MRLLVPGLESGVAVLVTADTPVRSPHALPHVARPAVAQVEGTVTLLEGGGPKRDCSRLGMVLCTYTFAPDLSICCYLHMFLREVLQAREDARGLQAQDPCRAV